jgi:hypothetical protein
MKKNRVIKAIVQLVAQAQELALTIGIPNILQPGLVKEMIIASILGHELIHSKRDADACDPNNPDIKYEYLSCYVGGSGQLDRMFKEPKDKRKESLSRITRNQAIYIAIFYKNSLDVKAIYKVQPKVLLKEAERKLDKSKNAISHVGFSENWAKENGTVVYIGEKK